MIEYNRRMRQQLAVMREAANRGAQTCSLALLPPPQPSHKGQRAHTMDGVPDCALASCAPSSLYSRSPVFPSLLARPTY